MSARVRLAVASGPDDGLDLLVPLPCVFGRLPDNEVPLPHDSLASRKHARLSLADGTILLEDLGSRNGTFLLTGEPVRRPAALVARDLFRVGGTWFRLVGTTEEA